MFARASFLRSLVSKSQTPPCPFGLGGAALLLALLLTALPQTAHSAGNIVQRLLSVVKCRKAVTPKVSPGEPTEGRDGKVYRTQTLCYAGAKCAVILDAPAQEDSGMSEADWAKQLDVMGLSKAGGRVRKDLDSGTMNCHAYGCFFHRVPGIERNMFLQPDALDAVGVKHMESQYAKLLEEYFILVDAKIADAGLGEPVHKALNRDLVVFLNEDGVAVHTGVISDSRSNWNLANVIVQSKFGGRPIVDAPLALVAILYDAPVVLVYRRKP